MPVAQRAPLNYEADDLRAALEFKPCELRTLIDHFRREVHRLRIRMDEAARLDAMKFHPRGVHVESPEIAGMNYRRARSALHYLLQLDLQQRADSSTPQ